MKLTSEEKKYINTKLYENYNNTIEELIKNRNDEDLKTIKASKKYENFITVVKTLFNDYTSLENIKITISYNEITFQYGCRPNLKYTEYLRDRIPEMRGLRLNEYGNSTSTYDSIVLEKVLKTKCTKKNDRMKVIDELIVTIGNSIIEYVRGLMIECHNNIEEIFNN